MKKPLLTLLIVLIGVSGLFAQTKTDVQTASTKEKPKKQMEYQYKMSPEDSIRINQLLLDPPIQQRPLDINGGSRFKFDENNILILDKRKEY